MNTRNPQTGQYDYQLAEDSQDSIQTHYLTLKANQSDWNTKGITYRISIIKDWFNELIKAKEAIIRSLAVDTARQKVSEIEFDACIGLIQGWCYKAPILLTPELRRPSVVFPPVHIEQQWIPYQVVGVISPWNFPMLLALIDAVPALIAGSSVLLKPSEVTPRFMDPLEQTIKNITDLANVFKIIRGGANAGKAVVNTADIICFTGSVETGRSIALRSSERFIPAFLELGGKDPAIVLKDAALAQTTDAVLRSCAGATGQACQSLERIYVDGSIYDDFVNLLIDKANKVQFITKDNENGDIGPLIFEKQAQKIQQQIEDAKAQGAIIKTGGEILNIDGGLFCAPTVLLNVDHGMSVMKEETFGPLIPIMSFESEEEAIKMANDSEFGLSASVFSKNTEHAIEVAGKIDAGGISINDASLTNKVFDAEKNSFKHSGLYGSRMGDAGFTRFFRKKALLIQTENPETIFEQSGDK